MKYVLDVVYDDTVQKCRNVSCSWVGGIHEEPFRLCPLCFGTLALVNVYTRKEARELYPLKEFTDGEYTHRARISG